VSDYDREIIKPKVYRVFNPAGVLAYEIDESVSCGWIYQVKSTTVRRRKPSRAFMSPTTRIRDTSYDPQLAYDYFYAHALYTNGWSQELLGAVTLGTAYIPFLSFDSNLTAKAELKALLKLKNQEVNLAVAFGERAATAAGIAETAVSIAKAVKSVYRLDVRGAKRALGQAAKITRRERKILKGAGSKEKKARNLWLGMQYGWMPLLQDVHGSATELAKNDANDPSRYRATVKSRSSMDNKAGSFTVHYSNTEGGMPKTEVYTDKSVLSSYVRLDYCVASFALTQASRIGFTNPLSVAWELVPFSFVADWFYPIGDYINSLDADVGWDFLGGSETRRIDQRVDVHATANHDNDAGLGLVQFSLSGHKKFRRKLVSRFAYNATPVPELVKPKNPFSGKHLANAVALLSSVFRK
jgi:hypothetical protein